MHLDNYGRNLYSLQKHIIYQQFLNRRVYLAWSRLIKLHQNFVKGCVFVSEVFVARILITSEVYGGLSELCPTRQVTFVYRKNDKLSMLCENTGLVVSFWPWYHTFTSVDLDGKIIASVFVLSDVVVLIGTLIKQQLCTLTSKTTPRKPALHHDFVLFEALPRILPKDLSSQFSVFA